jgi:hypothetical protein
MKPKRKRKYSDAELIEAMLGLAKTYRRCGLPYSAGVCLHTAKRLKARTRK